MHGGIVPIPCFWSICLGGSSGARPAPVREIIMEDNERIDALKKAAGKSGLSIDLLHHLTQDLSRQAFLSVIGRASSMPSYMKSIDSPYLLRKAKAPSSDSR